MVGSSAAYAVVLLAAASEVVLVPIRNWLARKQKIFCTPALSYHQLVFRPDTTNNCRELVLSCSVVG